MDGDHSALLRLHSHIKVTWSHWVLIGSPQSILHFIECLNKGIQPLIFLPKSKNDKNHCTFSFFFFCSRNDMLTPVIFLLSTHILTPTSDSSLYPKGLLHNSAFTDELKKQTEDGEIIRKYHLPHVYSSLLACVHSLLHLILFLPLT